VPLVTRTWPVRTVLPELEARYLAEGWWTDSTLGELVAASAARYSGNTFQVYSDVRPWAGTFAEVDRDARALAGSLRRMGVSAGDVVAMQLPNWAEAGVAFWASMYLGAAIVPIVHFYGSKEVEYILQATEPEVVITPDHFRKKDYLSIYEPLLVDHPASRWLVVGDTAAEDLPKSATPFAALLDGEPLLEVAPVDPGSVAFIGFTSGTTSDPKGVLHSHRTIAAEMNQGMAAATRGGAKMLTGAPVGHITGMMGALLRPLFVDSDVHMVDVWEPGKVLELMLDQDLIMGGGPTYFLTSLLDHPDFTEEHLRCLPACGMGGSTVPIAVTERATKLGIRIFRSYGSTEHPSITGCTFDHPETKRLTTDGCALAGVELRLDAEGEIYSRGPELFLGYTDPARTATVIDDDGWYRTGDVGVLDTDGYLTITDRVSDIIIRGGENVSAQEVEEAFLTIEGVAEVAVVAAPDDRLGEHVAAVYTTRSGASALTLEQVRTHFQGTGLSRQKWPESVHHVTELPRTASGKIQKFRLRDQLRSNQVEHLG
jgi:acyl-CoA synthetase (AMP-forming)/AMP-acid ligase II